MRKKNEELFNKKYYKIIKLFSDSHNMWILLKPETWRHKENKIFKI
jgi:hypothetical protein